MEDDRCKEHSLTSSLSNMKAKLHRKFSHSDNGHTAKHHRILRKGHEEEKWYCYILLLESSNIHQDQLEQQSDL